MVPRFLYITKNGAGGRGAAGQQGRRAPPALQITAVTKPRVGVLHPGNFGMSSPKGAESFGDGFPGSWQWRVHLSGGTIADRPHDQQVYSYRMARLQIGMKE